MLILEIFLKLLAGLTMIVALAGCFLPILPGPPLAWVGLLIVYFIPGTDISTSTLVWTGVAAAVVTILDYVIPIFGTRLTGGTKLGVRGASIGLLVSAILVLTPLTLVFPTALLLILGPFLGAWIGEKTAPGVSNRIALKSALGAFVGFMLGIGLKAGVVLWYIVIYFKALL